MSSPIIPSHENYFEAVKCSTIIEEVGANNQCPIKQNEREYIKTKRTPISSQENALAEDNSSEPQQQQHNIAKVNNITAEKNELYAKVGGNAFVCGDNASVKEQAEEKLTKMSKRALKKLDKAELKRQQFQRRKSSNLNKIDPTKEEKAFFDYCRELAMASSYQEHIDNIVRARKPKAWAYSGILSDLGKDERLRVRPKPVRRLDLINALLPLNPFVTRYLIINDKKIKRNQFNENCWEMLNNNIISERDPKPFTKQELCNNLKGIYSSLAMIQGRCINIQNTISISICTAELCQNVSEEPTTKELGVSREPPKPDTEKAQFQTSQKGALVQTEVYSKAARDRPRPPECPNRQAPQVNDANTSVPLLTPQKYQALVAVHKAHLIDNWDFFLALSHPLASQAMKGLAKQYAVPARLWKYGVEGFLKLLLAGLPDSFEPMLTFIYMAYSMFCAFLDTVPEFEDTWWEFLGDLSRYRIAIEDPATSDNEIWIQVARGWYQKGSDHNPHIGRLYQRTATIWREDSIVQLFYYAKSLTVSKPSFETRVTILYLLEAVVPRKDHERKRFNGRKAEVHFIETYAYLFLASQDHEFLEKEGYMQLPSDYLTGFDKALEAIKDTMNPILTSECNEWAIPLHLAEDTSGCSTTFAKSKVSQMAARATTSMNKDRGLIQKTSPTSNSNIDGSITGNSEAEKEGAKVSESKNFGTMKLCAGELLKEVDDAINVAKATRDMARPSNELAIILCSLQMGFPCQNMKNHIWSSFFPHFVSEDEKDNEVAIKLEGEENTKASHDQGQEDIFGKIFNKARALLSTVNRCILKWPDLREIGLYRYMHVLLVFMRYLAINPELLQHFSDEFHTELMLPILNCLLRKYQAEGGNNWNRSLCTEFPQRYTRVNLPVECLIYQSKIFSLQYSNPLPDDWAMRGCAWVQEAPPILPEPHKLSEKHKARIAQQAQWEAKYSKIQAAKNTKARMIAHKEQRRRRRGLHDDNKKRVSNTTTTLEVDGNPEILFPAGWFEENEEEKSTQSIIENMVDPNASDLVVDILVNRSKWPDATYFPPGWFCNNGRDIQERLIQANVNESQETVIDREIRLLWLVNRLVESGVFFRRVTDGKYWRFESVRQEDAPKPELKKDLPAEIKKDEGIYFQLKNVATSVKLRPADVGDIKKESSDIGNRSASKLSNQKTRTGNYKVPEIDKPKTEGDNKKKKENTIIEQVEKESSNTVSANAPGEISPTGQLSELTPQALEKLGDLEELDGVNLWQNLPISAVDETVADIDETDGWEHVSQESIKSDPNTNHPTGFRMF